MCGGSRARTDGVCGGSGGGGREGGVTRAVGAAERAEGKAGASGMPSGAPGTRCANCDEDAEVGDGRGLAAVDRVQDSSCLTLMVGWREQMATSKWIAREESPKV